MKTDHSLAIALFVAIMGGAVALAIANDITAPLCEAASGTVADKEFDFGCVEFWLNRYQGLLGNLITAAVAGAALYWAAGQLVAANKQVEAANRQAAVAAAQAFRAVAEDYQIIREKLEQFGQGLGRWSQSADMTRPNMASSMAADLISRAAQIINCAQEVLLPLEAVHLRTGSGEFYQLTNDLRDSAGRILVLANEARVFANSDVGVALARLGGVKTECRACIEKNNTGLVLVRTRMKETWAEIQALHSRAIGT